MRILFRTFFLGGMLTTLSLQGQISQNLIDKAKAAKMSGAQIQQEIEKQVEKQPSADTFLFF